MTLEFEQPPVPLPDDLGWYGEAACLAADTELFFDGETNHEQDIVVWSYLCGNKRGVASRETG